MLQRCLLTLRYKLHGSGAQHPRDKNRSHGACRFMIFKLLLDTLHFCVQKNFTPVNFVSFITVMSLIIFVVVVKIYLSCLVLCIGPIGGMAVYIEYSM